MVKLRNHGGAREGAGRPRLSGRKEPTVVVTLKMTTTQRDKLRDLGGAQWVRDRIDEAPSKRRAR